jgi:hypothetical protein
MTRWWLITNYCVTNNLITWWQDDDSSPITVSPIIVSPITFWWGWKSWPEFKITKFACVYGNNLIFPSPHPASTISPFPPFLLHCTSLSKRYPWAQQWFLSGGFQNRKMFLLWDLLNRNGHPISWFGQPLRQLLGHFGTSVFVVAESAPI